MVGWRKFSVLAGVAGLVAGTIAFAPVLAQIDGEDHAKAADVAGGVEVWGSTRASYAADDGGWTSSASGSIASNLFGITADGTLEAFEGTVAGLAAIPAQVLGQQVVSVATNTNTTAIAVTADGAVHKWGGRGLPDGTRTPQDLGGRAVQVDTLALRAVVLLDSGRVVRLDAIGTELVENFDSGEVLTDVVKVVAGHQSTLGSAEPTDYALRADGSVVIINGQDGWATLIDADPADPVVDIAARTSSQDPLTAVTAGGTAYAGGEVDDRFPSEIEGDVRQVARLGNGYAAVVTTSGDVTVWNPTDGSPVPESHQPPAELADQTILRLEGGSTFRAIVGEGGEEPGLPDLEVTEQPTIAGTPEVGQTLTATPAEFNDDPLTLSHAWFADGEPIEGADGTTFQPTEDELGATITYATTATREADDAELASEPSNGLGPVVDGFRITSEPGVFGDPFIGQSLQAELAPTNRDSQRPRNSIQWYLGEGDTFEPVAGATGGVFRVTAEHAGQLIRYVQTARITGATATAESATVGPVREAPQELTVTEQPTIAGTERVGETLTATPATFSDDVGVTLEHQWYADDELVDGATGPTLALDASHEGAVITYATKATRAVDGAEVTSERSNQLGPIEPAELAIIGQPTITGQPYIGTDLTVEAAAVTDEDADITFQWKVDGDDVDGATDETFPLVESYAGDEVTVEQTATRGDESVSAESAPLGPVVEEPVELAVDTEATLTGTPRVGQTLTATPATFTDPEATVTSYWVIGGEQVEAEGTTLELTNDHVGQNVQFRTVATRGEDTATSTSATVGPVLVVLAATQQPSIAGTPQVGQTLVGTPATFNDTTGVTLTHQWKADGTNIAGATSTSLLLTTAHLDQAITLETTATRGSDVVRSESGPTADVSPAALTVTTKPSISGDAVVGATLTGTPAVFSATEGVTVVNAWLADGEVIGEATGATLELTSEHLGAEITFRSVATRGGVEVPSVSDPTGAVAPEPIDPGEPGGEDPEGEISAPDTFSPGDTITVTVGEDYAGQEVSVWLFSTPRSLGTFTVSAAGTVSVDIPTDVELGAHRLAVYDAAGDLIGWQDVTIVAADGSGPGAGGGSGSGTSPGSGSAAGGRLPVVGSSVPLLALQMGLALVVAGALAVGTAMRRRAD